MPWRIGGLTVRLVLLVTLLWGGFLTALSAFPAPGQLGDFQYDLRAGRVEAIVVQFEYGQQETPSDEDADIVTQVTWTADHLIWRRADTWTDDYTSRQFDKEVGDSFFGDTFILRHPPDSAGGFWPAWPGNVPHRWGWVVMAAWVMTILIMLGSTPRLANRWAWFWMFTVGQVGAPLYVLLESRPIWSALDPVPPRATEPLDGGRGCLLSFLLAMSAGLLAWGIGSFVAHLTS